MLVPSGSRCSPLPLVRLLAAVAVAGATLGRAAPDDDAGWSGRATSQLQQIAQQAIERQQFADAVPALAELDRRYRESAEPAIVQAREGILYFLGIGRLQAADLEGAAAALGEFLQRYPNARQAPLARLFRADAFYYQAHFDEARATYEGLTSDPSALGVLDGAQQLAVWDRLSDCCFIAQDWEEGPAIFRELARAASRQVDRSVADEKRAKAGSYLLQAAIARDELDVALAALPGLTSHGGPTRHDLSLNLALMRGGDAFYERGRHGEALFFYELVLLPTALSEYWEAEIERLEAEQARWEGVWSTSARGQDLDRQVAVARQRLDHIAGTVGKEVPNYGPALQFRIARCYLARERCFEAYWAFDRLRAGASQPGGEEFAEEALYGCLKSAAAMPAFKRARRNAREYLGRREYVRFVGDVASELLKTERAAGRLEVLPELAREFVDRVREQPELFDAAKLVYLAGSTLLEVEALDRVRELFGPLAADFPDRPFLDGVHYWLGLAAVFAGEFDQALARFETVGREFPTGPYAEDAAFRIGVCRFGLLEYGEAQRVLGEFLVQYPESRLASEALALLGDLAAAEGRIEEALASYRAAETAGGRLDPPNLGYINHAIFQGGRLLAANRRWEEMADWFEGYIQRWGNEGRLSEALYELGRAQEALGRREQMLESWLAAIIRFGDDPEDQGPDLMLAQYPPKYRAATGEEPITRLREELEEARASRRETLTLRLAYALRALGEHDDRMPRAGAADFSAASVAVLARIAECERESDPELALAAVEAAINRGADSPFREHALHVMGRLKTERGDLEGALAAYREAAEAFPASAQAARARLSEGDQLRELGRFEEAIAAYRKVLQTRQWRGAAWAEANYKIGLACRDSGKLEEAFAFCQRVYVLYGGLSDWAAPAYLESGRALEGLGRPADAAATYRELLSKEGLSDTAAGREAAVRLAALTGSSSQVVSEVSVFIPSRNSSSLSFSHSFSESIGSTQPWPRLRRARARATTKPSVSFQKGRAPRASSLR